MLIRLKALRKSSWPNISWKLAIPNLFTYLNAIFGFLSILKSCEQEYSAAAFYIILAVIMDACDGRLARALGVSSGFGMELDSLCDAISFCLAPIILIYSCFSDKIGLVGKTVLAFYLCAGLARLAKFNTSSNKQNGDFVGLPTTIAAFFIALLVWYHNLFVNQFLDLIFIKQILFSIVFVLALLMISKITFYSFKKYKFNFYADYQKILILLFVISFLIIKKYPVGLIFVTSYIIFCLIKNIIHNYSRI